MREVMERGLFLAHTFLLLLPSEASQWLRKYYRTKKTLDEEQIN
jgi:hypothetical protein